MSILPTYNLKQDPCTMMLIVELCALLEEREINVTQKQPKAAEQTTLFGSLQPGKYFVFSCFKLIISDSFFPSTTSS